MELHGKTEFKGLRSVWAGDVPEIYANAVKELKARRLCSGPYVRPQPTGERTLERDSTGPTGANLTGNRLIDEAEDPERHLCSAQRAKFPQQAELGGARPLDEDLKQILRALCSGCIGNQSIPAYRRDSSRLLVALAKSLGPFSQAIRGAAQPPGLDFTKDLHVALFAALVDAMEWPDTEVVRGMLSGMNLVGHVQDTGLFAAFKEEDLVEKREFELNAARILCPDSNEKWINEIEGVHRVEAHRGLSDDMKKLEAATKQEVDRQNLSGPYSREEVNVRFGKGKWRPMRRFGKQEATKLRPVDDGASSRTNDGSHEDSRNYLPDQCGCYPGDDYLYEEGIRAAGH